MNKIAVLTVALVLAIFVMPTYAGPPAKPAIVVNEPTVHVGSMPDVNIADTPLPVTVTSHAKLKDALFHGTIPTAPPASDSLSIIKLPGDKVFVLTDVDLRCDPNCKKVEVQIEDRDGSCTGDCPVRYRIVFLGPDVNHDNLQLTSGITFEPDHEVFALILNKSDVDKTVQLLVCGYLVDK